MPACSCRHLKYQTRLSILKQPYDNRISEKLSGDFLRRCGREKQFFVLQKCIRSFQIHSAGSGSPGRHPGICIRHRWNRKRLRQFLLSARLHPGQLFCGLCKARAVRRNHHADECTVPAFPFSRSADIGLAAVPSLSDSDETDKAQCQTGIYACNHFLTFSHPVSERGKHTSRRCLDHVS